MFKALRNTFLQGLLLVLPMVMTIALLWWAFNSIESGLESMLKATNNSMISDHYHRGMGLLVLVVLIFGVGLFTKLVIFRRLVRWGERLLERVPLIATIYGAVKDILKFMAPSKQDGQRQQVVMVQFGDQQHEVIGFVTRPDCSDLPEGMVGQDTIAVYLPMSYQIGGFTVMVPRSQVRPIGMGVEEALKFVMTAGVGGENQESRTPSKEPEQSP